MLRIILDFCSSITSDYSHSHWEYFITILGFAPDKLTCLCDIAKLTQFSAFSS